MDSMAFGHAAGHGRLRLRGPATLPGRHTSTIAGGAGLLAGIGWLLLVPAAELQRRELLSYDGYNRLLAVPLLLITVALALAPRALPVRTTTGKVGLRMAAAGSALLLTGNVIEFYGVLFQDGLNAHAAHEAGISQHWIGSDVGWMIFGLGMLVLLVGGLTSAPTFLHHPPRSRRLALFAAVLGPGVLAGNLFALAPAILSIPVLGLYAAGWLWFAALLLTGDHNSN